MKKVIGLALIVTSLASLTAFAQTEDMRDLVPADELNIESVEDIDAPQAYSSEESVSDLNSEADFHHPGGPGHHPGYPGGHPGPHHPGNPGGYPGGPGHHPGPHHPGGPWGPGPRPQPGYPGYPGYPRPVPYPGGPGGGQQVVCFAQDGAGRNFRAMGMYPRQAQQQAMNQCYSYSTYGRCQPTGCRRW